MIYESMEARLLANCIEDPDGPLTNGSRCWLWTGRIDVAGYGVLKVRWRSGPRKGKVRTLKAHRVSVSTFTKRTVRRDYVVRHLCNVRCCINPDHLLGGTQKSNIRDMLNAGRHWSGFLGTKLGPSEQQLQRMKALQNRERAKALFAKATAPVPPPAANDECDDLDSTFRRFG